MPKEIKDMTNVELVEGYGNATFDIGRLPTRGGVVVDPPELYRLQDRADLLKKSILERMVIPRRRVSRKR